MATYLSPYKVFSAKAATGHSSVIFTRGFRNIIVKIGTSSSADMTVKFKGAITTETDTAPDFTAAQSETNQWDYIEVIDLENGSTIDGDTGVTLSGTDDYRIFEYNTNHLDYVTIEISAYVAGTITAYIQVSNDARK